MKTVIQPLAGAVQFTGLANAGLVTFSDLALTADMENQVPILIGVGLETRGVAVGTIDCFLMVAGEALTTFNRITIRTLSTENGFALQGCHIPVPRVVIGSPGFTPWHLVLITTGKTAQANFVASFEVGPSLS